MTVSNKMKAWDVVDGIFQTDYYKDEQSSKAAGYDIYRSNINKENYICDLGDRLEVNKFGQKSFNIWIG